MLNTTFAMADAIQSVYRQSFEYRHNRAVCQIANQITIAEYELKMQWRQARFVKQQTYWSETLKRYVVIPEWVE